MKLLPSTKRHPSPCFMILLILLISYVVSPLVWATEPLSDDSAEGLSLSCAERCHNLSTLCEDYYKDVGDKDAEMKIKVCQNVFTAQKGYCSSLCKNNPESFVTCEHQDNEYRDWEDCTYDCESHNAKCVFACSENYTDPKKEKLCWKICTTNFVEEDSFCKSYCEVDDVFQFCE